MYVFREENEGVDSNSLEADAIKSIMMLKPENTNTKSTS